MKKKEITVLPTYGIETIEEKIELDGYPIYPGSEDIYNKGIQVEYIEDANESSSGLYADQDTNRNPNVQEFDHDVYGDDLDIPGSELDDQQESIGSEDEENNLYSLGDDTFMDPS